VWHAQARPAAFSVDLEDYHHPELVRRLGVMPHLVSRAEASTGPILDLLDRYQVKATFFVVGEVIPVATKLIERIVGSGHEIGCHTYTHRPLWGMEPEAFRQDLRRFKEALKEVAPKAEARGFRAPTFSIDRRTSWALRILEEEGFTYDSSIVPARGPLYGCPGAPPGIYRPSRQDFLKDDPEGRLVEFPAPVVSYGAGKFPVGGGLYLRFLPFWLYRKLVGSVLRKRAFFLYVHPWETDPGIPRMKLPGLQGLLTYGRIGGMLGKIERLLGTFQFTTMKGAIEASGFGV
jgi:polysaccharide deacetylase family protein (PEP-CTERM system associated)